MDVKGGIIKESQPRIYKVYKGWWVFAKPNYYSTKLFRLEEGQHFITAISMGQWKFIHSTTGAGWVSNIIKADRVSIAPEDEVREIIRVTKLAQESFNVRDDTSTVDDNVPL